MPLLFLVLVISTSAKAYEAPQVKCFAWIHNQNTGEASTTELKKSKMDPDYYAAELNQFEFGADYSFLPSDGIGLIVFDKKSKRFTESTPGFRRIGESPIRETDLKYYDRLPDGATFVAGLQCEAR